MANKAAKQLAAANASRLKTTHTVTAVIHVFFLLLRYLRSNPPTWKLYALSFPGLALEIWLHRAGSPSYDANGELRRPGEDLNAKGLTEYMWDVVWWTLGCVFLAGVLGDKVWWLTVVPPLYGGWLLWTTYTDFKKGMGGLAGGSDGDSPMTAGSNRQKKMEKRGGQKVQYGR